MKSLFFKFTAILLTLGLSSLSDMEENINTQSFQGKAYYLSKSKMDLGTWGSRLSEGQKKEIEARMKNRLQKSYVLTFNKEESFFNEEDKLDAMSGATDSWGKNFAPGDQYKNVKTNSQIQNQEFYGKNFLVNDSLQPITWIMGKETKQIGNYLCFKATASIPSDELTWFNFSWSKLRNTNSTKAKTDSIQGDSKTDEIAMTDVEAWYAPQIPVSHGPLEYWGLPGLILEVSSGNTTMLCTKIVMNPEDKMEIKAPEKGTLVTKMEYQEIISKKMQEFRNNRGGRGRG
ncbi:GLPGLI family protein [Winogradskyella bathintestinalis]|uniref:GLPGLI family protein n=1 Tax=Winogradskyella bathintestinalis TaxID=3035208 RepID=A0ABT7ZYS0_9FLAO|nr:GLPGLI family protein [Winogradskyella bathintestinalis]MDN3493898.1 GLPGLI family protein [Winogradskyella bathintestinalis]